MDEIWQQISCTRLVRTGRNLSGWMKGLAIHEHRDWWTSTQWVLLGRQNSAEFKKIVTLFSYTVWPSATKFGTMTGNMAQWRALLHSTSGELWSTLAGSTNFWQRISRTLAVGGCEIWHHWGLWPIDTCFPNFVNFGSGSRDTMRRHASVFTDELFCRSRLSVTLSTKPTKFCSRYLVQGLSEGDEIWHFGSPSLAVHTIRYDMIDSINVHPKVDE